MKLRTLLKRAHEIITSEHALVYGEFRDDDGSMTRENHAAAMKLKEHYARWLQDADRVLGLERPKTGSARRRKAVTRKIVVQQ